MLDLAAKNPNDTYSFVGNVPYNLAYVTKAGNAVTPAEVESQLRLPANYRTIKCRVFASEFDAWQEAARLEYVNVSSRDSEDK